MSRMDGCPAAAAIRALDREAARTVCIIACTANSVPEERDRALKSGMDESLSRPVDVDALPDMITYRRG